MNRWPLTLALVAGAAAAAAIAPRLIPHAPPPTATVAVPLPVAPQLPAARPATPIPEVLAVAPRRAKPVVVLPPDPPIATPEWNCPPCGRG